MGKNENQTSWGKIIAIALAVAIISAVVTVAVQKFLLGETYPGVTGGVAGGITAVVVMKYFRK